MQSTSSLHDKPSPGKRQKTVHHSTGPSRLQDVVSTPSTMYSFGNGVIDLTGSPPPKPSASPQQRRVSGASRPINFNPQGGAKKIQVKNLKTSSKNNPEQYCEKIWTQLAEALDILFSQGSEPFSLEELYRGVENVCKQGRAKVIFLRLRKRCTEEIQTKVAVSLVEKAKSTSPSELVRTVTEAWATWRRQMNTIRSIFYFMDRSYLLRSQDDPSIEELSIDLFRSYAFNNPSFRNKIVEGISDLLSLDMAGKGSETQETTLFKEAISMSQTLLVYAKVIEPELLKTSQNFFLDWQEAKSTTTSLAQYVSEVRELMARELERCRVYGLEETTRRDLEGQMHDLLISKQKKKLTNDVGVAGLMEQNQKDDLSHLYSLLGLVNKQLSLQQPFGKYISGMGASIIFDGKREEEMVPRLLQFKKKLDIVWEECFKRNAELGHTLRESFEEFMNKTNKAVTYGTDNEKPGEMIAKYVDVLLRGGSKAIPKIALDDSLASKADEQEADNDDADEESQINQQLDQVLGLFRFVRGKAVFEAFYKSALAKRLLMNRSASADAEKSMLARLKNECGPNFTHNLEQMFKDIEMAREENLGFKNSQQARHGKPPVDFSVNVCSASAWPTFPDVDPAIPRTIQTAQQEYGNYYKSKYNGRVLQWKQAQAHCQMTANFPKGRKEIVVSGFQAIVMLHFNDKESNESVSYEELKLATNLEDADLKRTLQSLACAKYRVLVKSPKGKDVNETDKFSVNSNFSDAKYRIKINQIQLKETKEETQQTHERVAADRQYETQAAIVRVMKREKKITHPLLVAEVINALKKRGVINAEDIKKQIDKLIDKDYMERAEDGAYEYIA